MTPGDYLAKAHRALASSRLLLADGDWEGACNRAYYAIERIRLVADYTGEMIGAERASWAVEQAASFVQTILQYRKGAGANPPSQDQSPP